MRRKRTNFVWWWIHAEQGCKPVCCGDDDGDGDVDYN